MQNVLKILARMFLNPAALVVMLVLVGIVAIGLSILLEASPRLAELLKVIGSSILGAGVFAAVTKAIVFGGVFRDTLLQVFAEMQRDIGIQSFDRRFVAALTWAVNGKNNIESIDILAHSSSKYLGAIKEQNFTLVRKVRLLVPGKSTILDGTIPSAAWDRTQAWHEIETTVNKWKALQSSGVIESLEVRVLSFPPMVHFLIVDGSAGIFGVFHPTAVQTGVSTLNTFAVGEGHPACRSLLDDLQTTFNTYFQVFSLPWEASATNEALASSFTK